MITLTDKKDCCGCQACANSCPKKCITMQADEEGFLYPSVNAQACVNCGLCEKVCPILHKPQTFAVLETYAAKHQSAEVKLKSSSGGMFTALAEFFLKKGGVVFGASFDKDWRVVHAFAENIADLDKLRRSKYVQSDIQKTYEQAKQFLEQGRNVLFTGTPCQIAGLRNFLGKEYKNLLTADLICHGTPSPAVWENFLKENFDLSQIKAVNFREKRIAWNKFYLSFLLADGLHAHSRKKTFLERLYNRFGIRKGMTAVYYNAFFSAFLEELINRPACHACSFRGGRFADFSMGDLWGNWPEVITAQDARLGISVMLLNTVKAKEIFGQLPLTGKPVDFNRVADVNTPLLVSPNPHPKRAEFFARYQTEKLSKLIPELLGQKPFPVRIFYKIIRRIFLRKK